jgi:hypothetical protein
LVDWAFYPLTTLPGRYDIVLCRFPEQGATEPGPKARPALVRTTAVMDDTGGGEVEVVYGTSVMKIGGRRFDLHVSNVAEMDWAGLFHPTRFDLDQRVWLPWAEEFFLVPKGKVSPVVGSLSPYMVRKLQEQYAYKQHLFAQVEAQMEADREQESNRVREASKSVPTAKSKIERRKKPPKDD